MNMLTAVLPDAPSHECTTNAPLAAAIAAFILAEEEMWASRTDDGYLPFPKFVAREAAFNKLKTLFETEFPHV